MAKLITSAYEYALYDDAQGNLTPTQQIPPTYPPTLKSYKTGNVATAAFGYGTQQVASTSGAPQVFVTQPGATLTLIGDAANTTLLQLQQSNRPLVPGGAPSAQLYWYVGPNQTVTLPGVLNGGTITVQPVNVSYAVVTAPYMLGVMWSV